MSRLPFSQAVKKSSVNIGREYERLYTMFYLQKFQPAPGQVVTLRDCCAMNFANLPFRGTCVNLDDFDESCGYAFEKAPDSIDIDYLVRFCEYTYNLLIYSQGFSYNGNMLLLSMTPPMQFFIQQILNVIEAIGYMANNQDGITDFVPKDQAAISVSAYVDPNLSYRIIEYNHYSMKGDLNRKREILLALANKLEPQRKSLGSINSSLASDLFYLFNAANIRHNNTDPEGEKYNPVIAAMDDAEREKWYDDTYQMCLLAFLELEHAERKKRIAQLKQTNQK